MWEEAGPGKQCSGLLGDGSPGKAVFWESSSAAVVKGGFEKRQTFVRLGTNLLDAPG